MDFNNNYIDYLIHQCLNRKATDDERKTLLSVLKYTDDERIKSKIEKAFQMDQVLFQPPERIWEQVQQNLHQPTLAKPGALNPKIRRLLKYAAVIVFMLSFPLYFFHDELLTRKEAYKSNGEFAVIADVEEGGQKEAASPAEIQLLLSESNIFRIQRNDSAVIHTATPNIEIVQSAGKLNYRLVNDGLQAESEALVYHTLKVPFGKRMDVSLVDGTTIKLNSGTTLRFPINSIGKEMDLFLTGEAYFEVAKAQHRKFNVHVSGSKETKKHTIQVLGTKFNIKAYASTNHSVTTLFEGSVQVAGLAAQPILLVPMKEIVVSQDFKIRDTDLEMATSWRNNVFHFNKISLLEACQELERWYGIKFYCKNELKAKKILAQISRDKSLQEVLYLLAQTQDILYTYNGKEVHILGD